MVKKRIFREVVESMTKQEFCDGLITLLNEHGGLVGVAHVTGFTDSAVHYWVRRCNLRPIARQRFVWEREEEQS